eukprot:45724-Eustigmatos_ZCMA.PRE.1
MTTLDALRLVLIMVVRKNSRTTPNVMSRSQLDSDVMAGAGVDVRYAGYDKDVGDCSRASVIASCSDH